jgi:hypothetical protein
MLVSEGMRDGGGGCWYAELQCSHSGYLEGKRHHGRYCGRLHDAMHCASNYRHPEQEPLSL